MRTMERCAVFGSIGSRSPFGNARNAARVPAILSTACAIAAVQPWAIALCGIASPSAARHVKPASARMPKRRLRDRAAEADFLERMRVGSGERPTVLAPHEAYCDAVGETAACGPHFDRQVERRRVAPAFELRRNVVGALRRLADERRARPRG